jgi:uncharacterized membrane protein YfcA
MTVETALLTLILITLFAATVNGALGYGFSSLTVPVALLFYSSRVLSPALVLVEVVLNSYMLLVNRKSFSKVWRRVLPILIGLVPGVIAGSYALSQVNSAFLKVIVYVVLLPLILCQAAGLRRPISAERIVGLPLGLGVGLLYSVTTISGPPLALMLNNQGFKKEDFRAALGVVRVAESTLTAIAYYFLGLFAVASIQLLPAIVPSVVIGLPIGVFVIRRMNHETFRRICMSFDAWVVAFGTSQALINLGVLPNPSAYIVLVVVAAIDLYLLAIFFGSRRAEHVLAPARLGTS